MNIKELLELYREEQLPESYEFWRGLTDEQRLRCFLVCADELSTATDFESYDETVDYICQTISDKSVRNNPMFTVIIVPIIARLLVGKGKQE